MPYHLICVHPFGAYEKGQLVTDADEVKALLVNRDHHFVRIAAPDEAPKQDAQHDA
jgi:hypothetical protein